ncbi:C-C motif chemokine 20 [Cuculus canorus]|uniref:C-C motif chemokine 20 n=1 Tax=Cuculus canorus TaxID=55661 RepID=UPI0023AA6352|nr:C-C motif chemokine 20 [Cuculus canorus]
MMEFAMGKSTDISGTRPRVNSRGSCHCFISRWRCSELAGQAGSSQALAEAQLLSGVEMTGFSSKSFILVSLLGLLTLLLCGSSKAQSNQDCCLSYTKVRLPRWALKGYSEQLSGEVCDIHAIIFHTYSGLHACVNPKEGWVKKHLLFLSQKLRKMSM